MNNRPFFCLHRNRRGVALVMVLAILTICLGLIVAFLSRSTSQIKTSGALQKTGTGEELINTTISLVTAQVNFATSEGNATTWASQPGMVRTLGSNGALSRIYKLYSSDAMVATSYTVGLDLPPADWSTSPARWTDLNEPSSGAFPILDPVALGTVDGFIQGSLPAGIQSGQMPVRWLYVMADGTIEAPASGTTSVTIASANSNNPIVGRVAFWTDDETCKVNVNTASQGVFWDTPRASTDFERNLAKHQPAQREFQRYPGHPSLVNIGTVVPTLTTDQIYSLTPKIVGGGSQGGTAIAPGVLVPDSDRLYASVDEILLTPDRSVNDLTKKQVSDRRFLITAHSRAPEVNLYDFPRISIWPVQSGLTPASKVSVFDRLLSFCSSINAEPYYFQRSNAQSATNDVQIPRNEVLLRYLEYLTSQPVPGFGGTFSAKYPADRSRILLEIFDYIRSTNLEDGSLGDILNSFTGKPVAALGFGQVTPSRRGDDQGFGRFPVLSEVALQFICTADQAAPGSNDPATNRTLGGVALTAGQKKVEMALLLEMFVPSVGFPIVSPDYTVRIEGLNSFSLNGTTLGLPPDAHRRTSAPPYSVVHGRAWGGVSSFRVPLVDAYLPARGSMPADVGATSENQYPFVSQPVTVSATTMPFVGGEITLKIYAGRNADTATAEPVTTYRIKIDDEATLPVPSLDPDVNQWTYSRDGIRAGQGGRVTRANGDPNGYIRGGDVIMSYSPVHSDYRLLARKDVDVSLFKRQSGSANQVHSLSEGARSHYFGGTFDERIALNGITYHPQLRPDYPSFDVRSQFGDWDTGIALAVDGAYINMPDEGDISTLAGGGTPYFDADWTYVSSGNTYFSPNRKMPSAGMFGSLPSGVKSGVPWRTLLFRPQSAHPSHSLSIPDHALLDLFWMPVVEPYAISDPFSTAGKINMNFEILPFSYIERSTGLHALLSGETVAAIPNNKAGDFKLGAPGANPNIRRNISVPETLNQFLDVFAAGRVFRSATEICDLHIVPLGQSSSSMTTFWNTHAITGDNLRERIYTTLYPRLTTKSNTFTVHYRVQALTVPKASGNTFDESKHIISAERRGAVTVERYLDPNDTSIPDYASLSTGGNIPSATQRLAQFYRWRTVETRKFPSP